MLGSLVSQAHSYQLVGGKTLLKTDFRVTLEHITQSASLAKIDPDTGLQVNEGPGVNRYVTASARRYFGPVSFRPPFRRPTRAISRMALRCRMRSVSPSTCWARW